MSNLSMGAFISLKNEEKVSHYNSNIARVTVGLLKWELALKEALATKNIRLIANFSGLTPFYKALSGHINEDPVDKPAGTTVVELDVTKANEMLLALEVSPKVAKHFEGMSSNDLVIMTDKEILALKGIGKTALAEIQSKLPEVK